jgi:hypothetical protein
MQAVMISLLFLSFFGEQEAIAGGFFSKWDRALTCYCHYSVCCLNLHEVEIEKDSTTLLCLQ